VTLSDLIYLSDDFELKIGATVLKRVTSNKYLGIITDDKLTWCYGYYHSASWYYWLDV